MVLSDVHREAAKHVVKYSHELLITLGFCLISLLSIITTNHQRALWKLSEIAGTGYTLPDPQLKRQSTAK